jgi:hypothetical protein
LGGGGRVQLRVQLWEGVVVREDRVAGTEGGAGEGEGVEWEAAGWEAAGTVVEARATVTVVEASRRRGRR